MISEALGTDAPASSVGRHFLLLQMPCGKFGRDLQRAIKQAGHQCSRVAINGGDYVNGWRGKTIAYLQSFADWPSWIAGHAIAKGVTDLVCYGDCRPYHSAAIAALKPLGITIHVLEEGYLRPNWITCERDGVNGNSALTALDLDRIAEQPPRPAEHMLQASNLHYSFAGIGYYVWTLLLTPLFPRYQTHRDLDIVGEAALWLTRLLTWPLRRNRTARALKAIGNHTKPVHLVLLQLNGDSQLKVHSDFQSTRHFVEHCIAEFAASNSADSLLVFKNHPLDTGVINLNKLIAAESARHGLEGRVFFVETGKLVPLLEHSVSAVAINSTACHQALLRGIPTLVLGRAVFNHPQIVSRMRLADFFKLRPVKSAAAYEKLISIMRQTCQFNGGFYTAEGRRVLLPQLVRGLAGGMPSLKSFETARPAGQDVKQAS